MVRWGGEPNHKASSQYVLREAMADDVRQFYSEWWHAISRKIELQRGLADLTARDRHESVKLNPTKPSFDSFCARANRFAYVSFFSRLTLRKSFRIDAAQLPVFENCTYIGACRFERRFRIEACAGTDRISNAMQAVSALA
jgi:hypothetical protein